MQSLKPIKLPKDEFWADPFLFPYKGEAYVFFEIYSYKTKLGKISCGRIQNNEIVEVQDILDFDYHLSYPFIFEEDDSIFMIPETSDNNQVEIYKCESFPNKWSLYTTAFEGEKIVDTSYYKDENGQQWLFLNKAFEDHSSNLYIYKIDTLKLNKIEAHKKNPVIIDTRLARNAGKIFNLENKKIRHSQNNSIGVYGYGLNLNVIKKLTIDDYIEEKIVSIEPDSHKGIKATHNLSLLDDFIL